MPACFQMYATTKFEAENSDIDWGEKKKEVFYNYATRKALVK